MAAATTRLLCQSHLTRAGMEVPANHVIAGTPFCASCFRGNPPIGRTPPLIRKDPERLSGARRRAESRRDALRPRVFAAIAVVFEMHNVDWISANDLAREVEGRENWPWRISACRLRWILAPLGIRPERRHFPGRPGLIRPAYRRNCFSHVADTGAAQEPLRTESEIENGVLELAKAGMDNKEIARELGIELRTVKSKLAVIYRRMNLDAGDRSKRYKLIAGAAGISAHRTPFQGVEQSAAD